MKKCYVLYNKGNESTLVIINKETAEEFYKTGEYIMITSTIFDYENRSK